VRVAVVATTFPMPVIIRLICPGIQVLPPSVADPRTRIGAVIRGKELGTAGGGA
jgi:hypothetical protein